MNSGFWRKNDLTVVILGRALCQHLQDGWGGCCGAQRQARPGAAFLSPRTPVCGLSKFVLWGTHLPTNAPAGMAVRATVTLRPVSQLLQFSDPESLVTHLCPSRGGRMCREKRPSCTGEYLCSGPHVPQENLCLYGAHETSRSGGHSPKHS